MRFIYLPLPYLSLSVCRRSSNANDFLLLADRRNNRDQFNVLHTDGSTHPSSTTRRIENRLQRQRKQWQKFEIRESQGQVSALPRSRSASNPTHTFHSFQFQSIPAAVHHHGRDVEHGSRLVGNQPGQHFLPFDRRHQHHAGRAHLHSVRVQAEDQTSHPKVVGEHGLRAVLGARTHFGIISSYLPLSLSPSIINSIGVFCMHLSQLAKPF